MANEILDRIKDKLSKVESISIESHYLRVPNDLERLCEDILELLLQLEDSSDNKNLKTTYELARRDLLNIVDIPSLRGVFQKTLKQNAAKKRRVEYEEELKKTIKKIHFALRYIIK